MLPFGKVYSLNGIVRQTRVDPVGVFISFCFNKQAWNGGKQAFFRECSRCN